MYYPFNLLNVPHQNTVSAICPINKLGQDLTSKKQAPSWNQNCIKTNTFDRYNSHTHKMFFPIPKQEDIASFTRSSKNYQSTENEQLK